MRLLFSLMVLFYSEAINGQSGYKIPLIQGKSFSLYFDEAFRNNYNKRLDTIGLSGFCWVKFKVNPDGTLCNLEVSPGTPVVLSDFIKETLLFTNGLWKDRPTTEWLVLPVRYTLQKEGKTENAVIDSYLLENFLTDGDYINKETQYTFLPAVEYISAFDGGYNRKKMKTQSN